MMEKMRDLRREKGLTMKELADIVGVGEAAISTYETGKREPSLGVLCAISEALGCSLDLLVTGKEKDRSEERSSDELLKEFREMPEAKLSLFIALMQAALADKRFQVHLNQDGRE